VPWSLRDKDDNIEYYSMTTKTPFGVMSRGHPVVFRFRLTVSVS